ncbi:MAG TPA: precorrin-3B C(17)-methyltransferase [Fibrobacteria bacterium]|nr:precorrin-3B C(17)-methyltransferase [Fibrobacteria bacterium]
MRLEEVRAPGRDGEPRAGTLRVVGIGPGHPLDRTLRAVQAIERSEVLMGYAPYLDSVRDLWGDRRVERSAMRKEVERCREALATALSGREVALLCSGDAGVYGMAGLVLEIARGMESRPAIEIVPGLTAANAAGASLGAPLMLDYAVVSLSDLLVPWDRIRRRLEFLAQADLPVVIYNPRSRGRVRQISEAQEIFLRYRSGATWVAVVTEASTAGEVREIADLASFTRLEIGMRSVVVVCGSDALRWNDVLLAPRGYSVVSA